MFVSTMWLPSTTRDRWCGRHPMVGCVACSGCVPCGCFGGYSVRETPGPIPNPVVKPYHADGTARGIWWESRTLPDYIYCLWLSACMAGSHKHMSGCFLSSGPGGDSHCHWGSDTYPVARPRAAPVFVTPVMGDSAIWFC